MTDVLEKEITGGPVTVLIAGTERALAYPLYAVVLYKQKTGDSLFDPEAWPRIDLKEDPERWLACLWAGLHQQQPDKSWKSPLTLEELGGLVDFRNAATITLAMVKALTQFMPKADKEKDPKVSAAGELPPSEKSPTSASSGLAVAPATASVAKSF